MDACTTKSIPLPIEQTDPVLAKLIRQAAEGKIKVEVYSDCVFDMSSGHPVEVKPEVTPIVGDTSPGRNDPCPCGSGKKYKKCCGG